MQYREWRSEWICGVRHVDQSPEMNPLWETVPVPVSVEEILADALTSWQPHVGHYQLTESRMERKLALLNTINFLEDF